MSRLKHVRMHLGEMKLALTSPHIKERRYWFKFHLDGAICAALHGEVCPWPKP